jgi:hypothetical protein
MTTMTPAQEAKRILKIFGSKKLAAKCIDERIKEYLFLGGKPLKRHTYLVAVLREINNLK